jgi:hypothetical protein
MKGKLLFVAGAAVGYVLGARAGRKRYEQIKSAASKVWESPGVQRQVEQAQDFAAARVGEIPGALIDGAKKVAASVSKRSSSSSSGTTTVSKPAAKSSGSSTKSSSGTPKSSTASTSKSASAGRASTGTKSASAAKKSDASATDSDSDA